MTRRRQNRNWRHTRRTRRQGTEEEDEAGEEQERNQRDKGRGREPETGREERTVGDRKRQRNEKYINEGSTGHPKPQPSKSILEEERKAKAHERKLRGIPTENPNTSSRKPETGERNSRSRKRRELGQRNTEGH